LVRAQLLCTAALLGADDLGGSACATASTGGRPTTAAHSTLTTTAAASLPPTEPPTLPPTPTPGIGATYTMSDSAGNSVTVTLTKVVDPQRAPDDPAAVGAHYVAGYFTITGVSGIFEGDVFNDAAAVDSNGTPIPSKVALLSGCSTDFTSSGQYNLTPGHSVSGCVPFEVLDGLHLSEITWDASGGNGSTWGV
jgi:hypothetical protein